ncbi:MAG: hypothetical protein KGZ65_12900 [Sphingomonadales bacterium]|nr:hypothetical protein [Sphingomonadaceae bacterium]MBS3932125.1 hypothetical protein [Sphingomonadales bacterium]
MDFSAPTSDRRAFLAAAPIVVAPAAVPVAALAAPADQFTAAVRKWEEVQNRLNAHSFAQTHPDDPKYGHLYEQHRAILGDYEEALGEAMNARAPDHSALIRKLQIIDHEGLGERYIDCLIDDVRHLAGTAG